MGVSEKDFLPAALEILEKPASPLGRFMVWFICSFFSVALAWAIIGEIDVVAVGHGKVAPIGQTKTVQSFESGVIKKIHVFNGTRVEQGDVLIELDPTSSGADVARLASELQAQQLKLARGEWIMKSLDHSMIGEIEAGVNLSDDQKRLHTLLAQSDLKEFLASQEALNEQIIEKENELKVSVGQLEKTKETLPLLKEQFQSLEMLAIEGIASRFQFLESKEKYVSRSRDITIEQDRMQQISASIRSLKKQKQQLLEEMRSRTIQDIADAGVAVEAITQELVKAEGTQQLMLVRAPVTGVVQQVTTHTIGGVVRSGDPLMNVVPENQKLQVETSILNKDIGFVKVGQEVEIKLEAFQFTKYGVVKGKLLSIDRDAVQDEKLGLIYPARATLEQNGIVVNGEEVPIGPGMGVTTEIKLGRRRLVEFVLSPIFRYRDESLRER